MRKLRLIFVDRNKLTRALFSYVLGGSSEIDVLGEASDRRSAMALIRQFEPDAIVTGYDLPPQERTKLRSGLRAEFPEMRIMELAELDEAVAVNAAGQTRTVFKFQLSDRVH